MLNSILVNSTVDRIKFTSHSNLIVDVSTLSSREKHNYFYPLKLKFLLEYYSLIKLLKHKHSCSLETKKNCIVLISNTYSKGVLSTFFNEMSLYS